MPFDMSDDCLASHTESLPLLKVQALHKSFSHGSRQIEVLKDINLELNHGEILALIGASGAGKSTFLQIIGTLDRPTQGTVLFENQDLFQLSEAQLAEFRNRRIGFVFQFHHLLPEFTALENTYLPALIQKERRNRYVESARSLLEEVGLLDRIHHKPGELSGGEQQRVAVARALIQNPDLVLADEPTGNLDTHTGEMLFDLLRELNQRRGTTFVIVTHNERLSKQADRLVHMKDGQLFDQSNQLLEHTE